MAGPLLGGRGAVRVRATLRARSRARGRAIRGVGRKTKGGTRRAEVPERMAGAGRRCNSLAGSRASPKSESMRPAGRTMRPAREDSADAMESGRRTAGRGRPGVRGGGNDVERRDDRRRGAVDGDRRRARRERGRNFRVETAERAERVVSGRARRGRMVAGKTRNGRRRIGIARRLRVRRRGMVGPGAMSVTIGTRMDRGPMGVSANLERMRERMERDQQRREQTDPSGCARDARAKRPIGATRARRRGTGAEGGGRSSHGEAELRVGRQDGSPTRGDTIDCRFSIARESRRGTTKPRIPRGDPGLRRLVVGIGFEPM